MGEDERGRPPDPRLKDEVGGVPREERLRPGYYGSTGRRRNPKLPLTPEQAAQRTRNLNDFRGNRWKVMRENEAAIVENPLQLENLSKMRRPHFEVVLMYLSNRDATMKELAAQMGYSNWHTVQRILKQPHVVAMIRAIRDEQVKALIRGEHGAQAMLKQAQTKAAKKVVDTIESVEAGPKLNLAAAESVLDRTGIGKMSAVQHHHVHELLAQMSPEELDRYGRTGEAPTRFKEVFAQLEGPQTDADRPV